MLGDSVVEVRPDSITKGIAVQTIIQDIKKGDEVQIGTVFCAGDDTTDEGIFKQFEASYEEAANGTRYVWGFGSRRAEKDMHHMCSYQRTCRRKFRYKSCIQSTRSLGALVRT